MARRHAGRSHRSRLERHCYPPPAAPSTSARRAARPAAATPSGTGRWCRRVTDPVLANTAITGRTYLNQPFTTAGERAPEATSDQAGARISSTRGRSRGIVHLNLPHDTSALIGDSLDYLDDHSYGAFVTSPATAPSTSRRRASRGSAISPPATSSTTRSPISPAVGRHQAGGHRPGGKVLHRRRPGWMSLWLHRGVRRRRLNLHRTWNTSGSVLTHFETSVMLSVAGRLLRRGRHLDVVGPRPHQRARRGRRAGRAHVVLHAHRPAATASKRRRGMRPAGRRTCDINCQLIATP